LISKLQADFKARAAYINAKVSTLVPSQIRGLRLKSETPRQPDLAAAAHMHQSRISMLETAGANPTIATLSEIAAALKVGLKVEFVPFSEMLAWENNFRQDEFEVVTLDRDQLFLNPAPIEFDTSWISLNVLRVLREAQREFNLTVQPEPIVQSRPIDQIEVLEEPDYRQIPVGVFNTSWSFIGNQSNRDLKKI
jgi:transcriptional regulator with XRE-family HTH domain